MSTSPLSNIADSHLKKCQTPLPESLTRFLPAYRNLLFPQLTINCHFILLKKRVDFFSSFSARQVNSHCAIGKKQGEVLWKRYPFSSRELFKSLLKIIDDGSLQFSVVAYLTYLKLYLNKLRNLDFDLPQTQFFIVFWYNN